jgi:uptake hydrogenase large subunit
MTRALVGPFNRVEGDLQLQLDISDGRIAEARVSTTLYRGFEPLLAGRPPLDALVIAPRICGICSLSQTLAAAAVLREASGGEIAVNGALAANIAHAAENIADHLTHFHVFFMPDFAGEDYAGRPGHEAVVRRFKAARGEAQAEALPARRRLLKTMGTLAGKWPHSLAFQPGGSTRALTMSDRVRLIAVVAEFEAFCEETLFGAPLDEVIALETLDELAAYAERGRGDFAAFLRLADELGFDRVGRGPGPLMSFGAYLGPEGHLFPAGVLANGTLAPVEPQRIVEDVSASWFAGEAAAPAEGRSEPDANRPDAYSWAKAPRYAGQPVAAHPLALAMLAADGGSSARGRVVARLLEIALLTRQMGAWLRRLDLRAPFLNTLALPREATSVGRIEAARGSLGHWLRIEGGEIANYQIIAPTTWNFSPRDEAGVPGPLEGALQGVEVGARGAKAAVVQHIVRSFDPCMVCAAH